MLLCAAAASLEKNHQVPGTRDHQPSLPLPPADQQQQQQQQKLVAGGGRSAVVVVAVADCGGGGVGHLCVTVVLVVGVKFYLIRSWYQVKGFCADAHRLTMKAISQSYFFY